MTSTLNPVIVLHSTHGDMTFDLNGRLISDLLDCEDYPLELHPFELDIHEWQQAYPDRKLADEHDILDWAYWTRSAVYEAPAEDWRNPNAQA